MDRRANRNADSRARTARRLEVMGGVLFFGGILGVALPGVARPAPVGAGILAIGSGVAAAVLGRVLRRGRPPDPR